MSRRPALLTEFEVKRILNGAQKAGITMGILVTKDQMLFLPVDMIEAVSPASALQEWRKKRDEEASSGRP